MCPVHRVSQKQLQGFKLLWRDGHVRFLDHYADEKCVLSEEEIPLHGKVSLKRCGTAKPGPVCGTTKTLLWRNSWRDDIADVVLEKDLKHMACGFYHFTLAKLLAAKRVKSLQGKKVSYWPLNYQKNWCHGILKSQKLTTQEEPLWRQQSPM